MPRTKGYIWMIAPPIGVGEGKPLAVFTVKTEMFQWLRGLKVASNNRVFKAKDAGGGVEFVSSVGKLLGENNPGKDDEWPLSLLS
jgi:hypothetical protein